MVLEKSIYAIHADTLVILTEIIGGFPQHL
jgi:hypothetical protein